MIYDDKGNPFYWHTNKERSINFNLPKGKYSTQNKITKQAKFKPYGNGKYPNTPAFRAFLKTLKIYCRTNPNKASISLQQRIIIVDPKFYNSVYKPLQAFTLGHEVFHYFYHSKAKWQKANRLIHQHIEKQCDKASANLMLAKGYNPTQVSLSVKLLLKGQERKDCIRDHTTHKKNNFRR